MNSSSKAKDGTNSAMFTNTNFAQMFIFDVARDISKARRLLILEKDYMYIDMVFSYVQTLHDVFSIFTQDLEGIHKNLKEEIEKVTGGDFIHVASVDSAKLKELDDKIMGFYRQVMQKLGQAGLVANYRTNKYVPAHMDE